LIRAEEKRHDDVPLFEPKEKEKSKSGHCVIDHQLQAGKRILNIKIKWHEKELLMQLSVHNMQS